MRKTDVNDSFVCVVYVYRYALCVCVCVCVCVCLGGRAVLMWSHAVGLYKMALFCLTGKGFVSAIYSAMLDLTSILL